MSLMGIILDSNREQVRVSTVSTFSGALLLSLFTLSWHDYGQLKGRRNGSKQAMSAVCEILECAVQRTHWRCGSQAATWASLSLLLPSWLPYVMSPLVAHTTAITLGCPLPATERHLHPCMSQISKGMSSL